MAKEKFFNTNAEAQAYMTKQGQKITAAITKLDAAIMELSKARAKASAKVPAGYSKQAMDSYAGTQKSAALVLNSVDTRIAAAKARAKEAIALCKG